MGQPVDALGMSPPKARPRLRGSCGAPIRGKRCERNPHARLAGQVAGFERIVTRICMETEVTNLTDIRGVGPALASKMREMGIQSAADLARADAERLTALPRVQLIRARMLIAAAEEMLDAAAAGLGSAPTPQVTAKSEAVAMEEPQAVGEPEPEAAAPPEEVKVATATTAKKTKPSKKAKKSAKAEKTAAGDAKDKTSAKSRKSKKTGAKDKGAKAKARHGKPKSKDAKAAAKTSGKSKKKKKKSKK